MKQILASFVFSATLAAAQPAISPPQIGFVLDKTNAVRPVFGVAGSFTLGDSIGSDVVSGAFLGSFGFAKTSSAIAVFDRDGQILYATDAPPGPALFGSQLAYLTQTRLLLRWTGTTLEPISLPFDDEVLSIAQPDSAHASAIVRRDDGLWLVRSSLDSGAIEVQSAIPGVDAPVLILDDGGFVFQNQDGIVIRRSNGSEIPLAARLSEPVQIQSMGNGWLQITDAGGPRLAVDIRQGREQIYQLPEAQQ